MTDPLSSGTGRTSLTKTLVQRLRISAMPTKNLAWPDELLTEAADEIERLRGALQVIAGRNTAEGAAAREALGEGK